MASALTDAEGRGVLEDLAEGLENDAHTFTPDVEDAPSHLPGRRRGESLASQGPPSRGPGAIILDCGTSRREGFTHVLWVSPSAEALLGSHVAERLADVIGTLDGVTAYEWDGLDHLHLRAAEASHADVLREARVVVAQLLA